MLSKDMELLKRALWEATDRVYTRELAACGEDAVCSRRHYSRMRKILGVAILPATNPAQRIKRRVIAALIAAAVLLTGCCTAYAYREQIKAFVETVFDNRIMVTYDNEEDAFSGQHIKKYYTLGYVPEGYELVDNFELLTYGKQQWENRDGERISFIQTDVNNVVYGIDDSMDAMEKIESEQYTVYHRSLEDKHIYLWNDGTYAFKISTTAQLSEEEILSIVAGLTEKKS